MDHLFTRLERTMAQNWDKAALANYKGECFAYKDLAAYIEKMHIFFNAAGVKKGEKIALCAKNSARWAVTFLSVITNENVVVPILSDFTPEGINNLVAHSEALVLFTDTDMWATLDINVMPAVNAVVSTTDFSLLYSRNDEIKAAFESIEPAFAARFPEGLKASDVCYPKDNEKDICVINYTSGTTSAPKGVMLRYESFSCMVEFASEVLPCSNKDRIVSMLPMGHIYGLAFEFLYPLCNGVDVNYLGKTPSPSLLLKAMNDVKPYIIITVPLVMEKIFKSSIKPAISKPVMKVLLAIPGINGIIYGKVREKVLGAFGGNIREIVMGGAALNPDVEKVFKKMKLPYTVGYGMTEASPLLAYEDTTLYVPGSCGKAFPYSQVRIDSEDPEHIVGEIQAKGMNITSGYFNNPEASASAFTEDGYLHTGDLGIMDKDGNIFIRGRSKNMILSANGQNIYPEEVEAVVNSQDFVAESVVVDRSSKLVALVYLDEAGIKAAGLDEEAVSDIPETVRINANRILPQYSQITKVELVVAPFEKTPKMSIKRFLYK